MKTFAVRKGYLKYGGKAYFTRDFVPTKIVIEGKTYKPLRKKFNGMFV